MEAEGMRMLTLTDRNFEIVAEVGKVAGDLEARRRPRSASPGCSTARASPRSSSVPGPSTSWGRTWPDSSWTCPVKRPRA